jgi:tRNA (guanine26-N2/guanine27-N2)-dimethyltransferase
MIFPVFMGCNKDILSGTSSVMHEFSEGRARFYASVGNDCKISKELEIFYNPVMKFNRDVSILLLNSLGLKNIQVADIMAGSGVRAIRFILELNEGILKHITINDYDDGFMKLIENNLVLNNIFIDENKVLIKNKDANMLLMDSAGYDYIDIDPFGSPNHFLDAAISRISRKGVLAVTATDTAPLSGTFPDACRRKYWAEPLHNTLMHEIGLRILIRKIQLVGAQYDKALVPIYAYFKDHYFRVFLRCEKGKSRVDKLIRQHKYFMYCKNCMNSIISDFNSEKCSCDSDMHYSGPLWAGSLFDKEIAGNIYMNNKNSGSNICNIYNNLYDNNFLETIMDESKIQGVGFVDIHALAKKFKLAIPKTELLMKNILSSGYAVSRTHFTPLGIKTDMPLKELLELARNL